MTQAALKLANGIGEGLAPLRDDASVTLADAYLDALGKDDERRQILWHWRGNFYVWDGTAYRRQEPEEFHSDLQRFLRSLRIVQKKGAPKFFKPEPRNTESVAKTLARECQAPVQRMPSWLDRNRPDPADVIAFRNGLVDFKRLQADGLGALIPPTPAWFSENVLPYNLSPTARCPQWGTFLRQVLGDNDKGIGLLQEWFGYCMTADTRHQKLMMLVGPRRCGKGTICRALQRNVGEGNYANPTFAGLGSRFGLEPLVGKRVAIIPDAHLGRDSDPVAVLDKLLQISGEDNVAVEPKGKSMLASVKLGVRFTIACNEPPDLPDASGAIIPRLLMIEFRESFAGREDLALDDRLAGETPGIALWALEGLKRLRKVGSFTEPDGAADLRNDFERQSAPIAAFVEDRCELGTAGTHWVSVDEFYAKWCEWARNNGHHPGTKEGLGKRLRAATRNAVSKYRSKEEKTGKRIMVYAGIRVKTEDELF